MGEPMIDLEHSYEVTRECSGGDMSRLEYLADYIFDFTTYDSAIGELFARKALETCAAISGESTFDYIKDPENYQWFLLMVNMPFFAGRLNWGTSIRGAWWDHEAQKLETCGIWKDGKQITSMEFARDEWIAFLAALGEFAQKEPNAQRA